MTAWWFDPRTGEAARIGEYENAGERSFAPPGISRSLAWLRTGRGCDWVLVLDDAEAGFEAPGTVVSD